MAGMQRSPWNILKLQLSSLPLVAESGSEHPKGGGCSLSPPTGTNLDPTISRYSSPMHPVSNQMRFGNHTIRPSGGAKVRGSGSGRSVGSISGIFLISYWGVVVPTAYAYLPTAPRLLVLPTSIFPGGCTCRSYPKEGEKTPTPPSWII